MLSSYNFHSHQTGNPLFLTLVALQLCELVPLLLQRKILLIAGLRAADCRGIFDLEVYDIKGEILNLNRLSGRFVLVVNVHPTDPHWDAQLDWMATESESTASHPAS
jgi:hypothetical protein